MPGGERSVILPDTERIFALVKIVGSATAPTAGTRESGSNAAPGILKDDCLPFQ